MHLGTGLSQGRRDDPKSEQGGTNDDVDELRQSDVIDLQEMLLVNDLGFARSYDHEVRQPQIM